jgi:hypothetical protein
MTIRRPGSCPDGRWAVVVGRWGPDDGFHQPGGIPSGEVVVNGTYALTCGFVGESLPIRIASTVDTHAHGDGVFPMGQGLPGVDIRWLGGRTPL